MVAVSFFLTAVDFAKEKRELSDEFAEKSRQLSEQNRWHIFVNRQHTVVIENIEENSDKVSVTGTVDGKQAAAVISRYQKVSPLEWFDKCANRLIENYNERIRHVRPN